MEYVSPIIAPEPELVVGAQLKPNGLGDLTKTVGAQLRLVGELTPEEVDLLDELGKPLQFGDEGSISQRLLDRLFLLEPEEARRQLESIYQKVAAPLHLRPVLPALIEELEARRLSGAKWKDINDRIKLEVPLEGYAITVVDANGYTACLLEGNDQERFSTAANLTNAFHQCVQDVGAVLLEPVVGDAAKILTFNADQQARLEEALGKLHIPMTVEKLSKAHPDKYPIDPDTGKPSFTLSTGSCPAGKGLRVLAYAGKGNRRGGVIVQGDSMDVAETFQKKAGSGETLRAGDFGEAVPEPTWLKVPPLPSSILIAMKVIETLLNLSSHSEAAVAELLEGREVVSFAPRLEAYYAVLNLEAGNIEALWDEYLVHGSGTDNIVLFKPVGARELHFWSRDIQTPQQFQAAFGSFVRQMKKMSGHSGCGMKIGLGYEQALTVLRLPGSFQVDATGAVIVGTVRAVSTLRGREGDSLRVDKTACEALGLRGVEMTTRRIKNDVYQGVDLSIDSEGGMSIPEPLVGREKELTALHEFVDRLGQNGVALQVRKPDHAEEGGYGTSALLRATELYARKEKCFSENQVLNVGSGETLFADLEASLGYSVSELMEHPEYLTKPVLLLWDADTVSPQDAARVDRFLFAMIGAPIGLVYSGAYQFRPGVMMEYPYQGRALSGDLEVSPLDEAQALELVFQTRTDLDESHEARIKQLLRGWRGPFTPRLLIHNFSAALMVTGANCFLNSALLNQVWAGELGHILDAADLDETDRVALGVLAEIGFPVSMEELQKLVPGFDWFGPLQKLVSGGFLKNVDADGIRRLAPADAKIRKARLLARQYAPALRKGLMENNFFRAGVSEVGEDEERSAIELEHALGHAETCKDPKTFDLVFRLGRLYLNTKKDFGAAYELYHRFLQVCKSQGVDLKTLPQELVHDLVWALTQTKDKKDAGYARELLDVQPVHSAELFWRAGAQMPKLLATEDLAALPLDHPHYELMNQLSALSGELEGCGVSRHRELEKVLRLEAAFAPCSKEAEEEHATSPFLAAAFIGAALVQTAFASRLFSLLARELTRKMPQQVALITALETAASQSILDGRNRLSGLEVNIVYLGASTELDHELWTEILRSLLNIQKYLAPTPNNAEMSRIRDCYEKTEQSFGSLKRPVPADSLNAADVYFNATALHWQRKLPLPGVFEGEDEKTAGVEKQEEVWATLHGHEEKIRTQLSLAVSNALLPPRHRLTLQLMNFIQLKMRLITRNFNPEHRLLFEQLHHEYQALALDSARLYQLLEQRPQPDYYSHECLPIKRAFDQKVAGF
jgi:hypothetical protein